MLLYAVCPSVCLYDHALSSATVNFSATEHSCKNIDFKINKRKNMFYALIKNIKNIE